MIKNILSYMLSGVLVLSAVGIGVVLAAIAGELGCAALISTLPKAILGIKAGVTVIQNIISLFLK